MNDKENNFWHYTVAPNFNEIMKSGFIEVATKYVPEHEIPVVWFSANPSEEKTVRKGLRNKKSGEQLSDLGRDELFEYGVPQVRIEVDADKVKLFKWMADWSQTKISSKEASALIRSGSNMGANPNDWWYSFESVPMEAFKNIDVWDGGGWVRHWSVSRNLS